MNIPSFTKSYKGRRVLSFPGAEFEKGKIYALLGANGSGKSTFAKILTGVIPADEGAVRLPAAVGYMPQKSFAFNLSTEGNILLSGGDKSRARELMKALGLTGLEYANAKRLSGGETARMALARLLMGSYELVILDEPTAAMDMESCAAAEALITQYVQDTGCTLLLISHSIKQARRLAHEILFFCNGELTERGEKNALLQSPQRPETRQFLDFYDV